MLNEGRRQTLLELLRKDGAVVISEASRKLGVSEQTVRRDLEYLSGRGLVARVHGGAMDAQSVRFRDRIGANPSGKSRAIRKLTAFIPESGLVFLDGSTTVLGLIRFLAGRQALAAATSSLETFRRLSLCPGVQAILVGGMLDKRTDNLVGPVARRSLSAMAFDAAFFSCYALNADVGPMDVTVEDADLKQEAAQRARHSFVAVDRTKLERHAAGTWAPPRERATLATEVAPGNDRLTGLDRFFSRIV